MVRVEKDSHFAILRVENNDDEAAKPVNIGVDVQNNSSTDPPSHFVAVSAKYRNIGNRKRSFRSIPKASDTAGKNHAFILGHLD
jgi:hypothetical protein